VQCPFCKAPDTRVIDSRLAEDGTLVRRRRECERCGQRFTTFERPQLQMPNIVKRTAVPEPYSEGKLRRGMQSAVYKRPITAEQLDHAIENIERKLRFTGEREVPSRQVGEWVMEELRDLDHVAYVRFASIYRSFEDVNAFQKEIEHLRTMPSAEERKSQMSLIDETATRAPATATPPAKTRDKGSGRKP
jgi:transcriptional repressor NrdR